MPFHNKGNVQGNTGKFTSDVTAGSFTGDLTGNVTGDVTGGLTAGSTTTVNIITDVPGTSTGAGFGTKGDIALELGNTHTALFFHVCIASGEWRRVSFNASLTFN
jgi:hypothetical protein